MCGLRGGEICGLRWQDIDLDRGELAVIQTLQRVKGSGLTVQPPKSAGSRRPIALPQSAVRYLRHWRARQAEDKLAAGPAWRNGDYVCTTLDGGPLEPSELNRAFGKLIIELGLPHITLHGMRHTYASLALRAGVDIKRVQASLGHATAAFTLDVYGHVTASGLKDAAATFDRAVFGDTILDRF